MCIERIAQYDDGKGLRMLDAIRMVDAKNLRISSNKEIDARLVGTEIWKSEKEMYPCWTGTLSVYEEPGKPFGETVQFRELTVNIPKKFQGESDIVLLCNHPDFLLKGNEIALSKSVKSIPMPGEDGWYMPDPEFGFPTGKKIDGSEQTRKLWRRDDEAYAGLLARYYDGGGGDGRRLVGASDWPDGGRLGVFGESRNGKAAKHKHEWVCATCGVTRK